MYWSIGNNCTDFVSRENLSSAVRGWHDREYQRSSADQGNYKYNVIIFMLINWAGTIYRYIDKIDI